MYIVVMSFVRTLSMYMVGMYIVRDAATHHRGTTDHCGTFWPCFYLPALVKLMPCFRHAHYVFSLCAFLTCGLGLSRELGSKADVEGPCVHIYIHIHITTDIGLEVYICMCILLGLGIIIAIQ